MVKGSSQGESEDRMSGAAGGAGGRAGKSGTCKRCGTVGKMKQCSRCHRVLYCGAECQREDWRKHKQACARLAQEFVDGQGQSAIKRFLDGDSDGTIRNVERAMKVIESQGAAPGDDTGMAAALGGVDILCTKGKHAEALKKCEEVLEAARGKYGSEHEICALALAGIGRVRCEQGEFELALHACGEARRIQMTAPTSLTDASALAKTLSVMADVHKHRGGHEEALELYREVLGVIWVANPFHPMIVHALGGIGWALCVQEKYQESLEALNESLAFMKYLLGDEHPGVAKVLLFMGSVYERQGDDQSARGAFEASAAIFARAYDPEDERAVEARERVARLM